MLTIDLDLAHRGFWLSCGPCVFQGNLVEFGARLWRCDADQAYYRLGQELAAGVGTWLDRQHSDSAQRLQTLHLFDDEVTTERRRHAACRDYASRAGFAWTRYDRHPFPSGLRQRTTIPTRTMVTTYRRWMSYHRTGCAACGLN